MPLHKNPSAGGHEITINVQVHFAPYDQYGYAQCRMVKFIIWVEVRTFLACNYSIVTLSATYHRV